VSKGRGFCRVRTSFPGTSVLARKPDDINIKNSIARILGRKKRRYTLRICQNFPSSLLLINFEEWNKHERRNFGTKVVVNFYAGPDVKMLTIRKPARGTFSFLHAGITQLR
jgi:hypothetical protein